MPKPAKSTPKARQKPKRRLSARREYVDDLTGAPTPPRPGSSPTGRKVVRLRTANGGTIESIVVDDDDRDPAADTFGLVPEATERYRHEAERAAKGRAREIARLGRPMTRDFELELGRLGIATTFPSVRAAWDEFENLNLAFFHQPAMDDADLVDVTRDFMDGIEVGRGRKVRYGRRHVKLSKTARGLDILERRGFAMAQAMISYLFGLAGPRRRWRDVPWHLVDRYVELLADQMGVHAELRGGGAVGGVIYPLASGHVPDEEFQTRVVELLGPEAAQRIADSDNSKRLWHLVGRIEAVLYPPKGDDEGRKRLRCIPPAHRRIIVDRLKTLREWARHPQRIPEFSCVHDPRKGQDVTVCTFPAIYEDISRILDACTNPYDPSWPSRQRDAMWAELDRTRIHDSGIPKFGPSAESYEADIAADDDIPF